MLTVGQAGQGVVQRLEADPALQQVQIADVLDHGQVETRAVLGVAQHRHQQVDPRGLAVGAHESAALAELLSVALEQVLVTGGEVGHLVDVEEVGERAAFEIVGRVAEDFRHPRVDLDDRAVRVGQGDADRGAGEHLAGNGPR